MLFGLGAGIAYRKQLLSEKSVRDAETAGPSTTVGMTTLFLDDKSFLPTPLKPTRSTRLKARSGWLEWGTRRIRGTQVSEFGRSDWWGLFFA